MSTLDIRIGGREFAISCGPGDEERVRALATTIDEYFQPLAPRFSQNLLFACLRAADDVFEKSGVPPGEDPETRQLRERLADVEQFVGDAFTHHLERASVRGERAGFGRGPLASIDNPRSETLPEQ